MLYIEHISWIITNCGQYEWVIPSRFSITLQALLEKNTTRKLLFLYSGVSFKILLFPGCFPLTIFVIPVIYPCFLLVGFLPLSPPGWRGIVVTVRAGGRAGGCQTCGTHISVTAWRIFSIRSSVELSRPLVVHCHGHLPICPIWACPWAIAHGPKTCQIWHKLGPDFAERRSLKRLDGFTPFKVLWTCLDL